MALLALNGNIRVFNRPQRVETSFAIQTDIFVDGHISILILRPVQVNRHLSLFQGYLVLDRLHKFNKSIFGFCPYR